jgi:hypothetical protein
MEPKGVSNKKRTFGTLTFQHFIEAEGRRADLLPVKDAGDAGRGRCIEGLTGRRPVRVIRVHSVFERSTAGGPVCTPPKAN